MCQVYVRRSCGWTVVCTCVPCSKSHSVCAMQLHKLNQSLCMCAPSLSVSAVQLHKLEQGLRMSASSLCMCVCDAIAEAGSVSVHVSVKCAHVS